MLLKAIVDFLLGIVEWIFSLIPDIEIPFSLSRFNFVAPLANFWGYIDSFISTDILIACIGIVILIDSISFITRLIRFLLAKFALG